MRILLSTFGSLGDLYPYLAIGLGLKARGHDPIIATSAGYEETVTGLGLGFRAVRPDLPDPAQMPDEMRHVMDEQRGTETVLRRWVMPALRDSFDDLLAATEGVDLLVSHLLTFAAPLVAELRGLPWASSVLQPSAFFSVHDPPLFAQTTPFAHLPFLGPWFWRRYRRLAYGLTRNWFAPLAALRAELGLPPFDGSPLVDGHSPWLALALFSPVFGPPQPDWPRQTVVTGFPFFGPPGSGALPPDLAAFLDEGPPPVVFTLGSSAVYAPGRFYEASIEAAAHAGQRAVLLVGRNGRERIGPLPREVIAVEYVAHHALFPRAAALVHQGGIGTTAEALRAGKPMLVVPFAHDQPDNARRVARLGVGRVIPRGRFSSGRLAGELDRLLEGRYAARAEDVGARIREEDGVARACDALERLGDAGSLES
jgi:rhamnosyltransferase subunit B